MLWKGIAAVLCITALCCIPALAGLYEPTVIITDTEVTPAVLMPGETGVITVTLKNTAKASLTTTASAVTVTGQTTTSTEVNPTISSVYLESRDIEVLGGNSQFSGDLGPEQSIRLSFFIRAPETDGFYFPLLRVRVLGAESLLYPIPVNVNVPVSVVGQPMLLVSQSGPEYVRPGDEADVRLDIANAGRGFADDLFIRIVEDDPSLAPKTTGSFHVDRLEAGASTSLLLTLVTDTDLEPGIREVALDVRYYTVDGVLVSQTDVLSLDVRGRAAVGIASVKTDPVRVMQGDEYDLIIRLENTGTGDATSTKAEIDLPFSGNKESFIGKIKPDNDAPAVFSLDASGAGDYDYTLTVTYEDDWGAHTETFPLTMPVRSKGDGGTIIVGVFFIALIAAGAWYWFVYRKQGGRD
ncbi:MAG: S-layer protein [Methanomicrobiales archaeon]|nr:S-layer protein [Methanomicrobiales archaeon]